MTCRIGTVNLALAPIGDGAMEKEIVCPRFGELNSS